LQTQKYHNSSYLIAVKQFDTKNHNFTSATPTNQTETRNMRGVQSERQRPRARDQRTAARTFSPAVMPQLLYQQHGRATVINHADIMSAVVDVYLQLGG